MIDKTYDAAAIEPRIAARWDQANAFAAGAGAKAGAEAYSIVIPPPNVTGSLHMGHALNDTLQDVLIRFERMRGKNVLWQPGLDHAGIATQMVVERQMAASGENVTRRELGRERFIERVWQWKAESGGAILGQLKRLGASCDWSRERFTMDEGLSKAVLHVFVELYRKGWIYRDKRLVNWDPKFETAISDLEVENREIAGHMWHFKYPLAGGETYEYVEKDSDGNVTLRETRDYISIATTRPETMLGDGAVAVHPDDERYAPIVGKLCEIPVGPKEHRRLIPIITDEYPDPDFGSGAVKITGAHDFNDYQVARRNDIPLYRLMDTRGAMRSDGAPYAEAAARAAEIVASGGSPDAAVVDEINLVPDAFRGLDRFAAREKVVAEIDAEGLMIKVEDRPIMQPFGDRSGVVIEPMLTDQWFANAAELAKPAIASVREGRTAIVPKTYEKTYFDWMENIQPWCVSRQLWWGHQIPAWYGDSKESIERWVRQDTNSRAPHFNYKCFVGKDEEEVRGLARQEYGENVEINFGDAFAYSYGSKGLERVTLRRDEDVLDTWFSSALWPFSTLGWPDETPELATYYPTSVLVTGFDIIFFWVARMMMMGLEFTGTEPFHTIYMHALVRDKNGAKMSKSKGNVVDPLDLIDEYGADALRFTLAIMTAQGRDVKLDTQRIAGYRNFGTKLWNATRFAEMNGAVHGEAIDPDSLTQPLNRWIVTELSRAIAETNAALEGYRFNDAAATLYRFVWNLFCDWYVELAKPALNDTDEAAAAEVRSVMGFVLDRIYALLHPFMPFITEELWSTTAEGGRATLLCHADWPAVDFTDREAADDINWLVDLVSEIRSVRAEMNVPPGAQAELQAIAPDEATRARIERHRSALQRLARLSKIETAGSAPEQSAQIVVGGQTFALPLAGMIDIAAERARLTKAHAKAEGEMARIDKKLSNERFIANAPDDVVEQERTKREGYRLEAEKLAAALTRLQ
ncbi:valine--tRNA ligase [Aurantimonas sp. VKM B-3413]|uniref:valine--tRNA ligase n=1 Tax=Aurantimonas sp. VKM B-3413 TaxID=2779401 RepID=UPI001E2E1CC1|nr:valine--tRNA ligase [Aurantimonas sp. VKM B-3413]MCB8840101.1 valine--tRNA ligase [Aurantimonas sp. VKM B-3413]